MVGPVFYVFWTGVLIVLYTYLGYGIVILILSKIKGRSSSPPTPSDHELPEVTIVIAAYNEEDFIDEKIKNSLALNYPEGKLSIFIVSDGSNDNTAEIIGQYPSIKLFHQPERKGKIHAVNRIMKFVQTPIVIFCDANTYLNQDSVKNIVRHYQDDEVGGVAGEKRIFKNVNDSASGSGEGLYWKYESFLKRKDSEVYSVVGAAGELFSIRASLYEEPAADIIIEDFYISIKIAMNGYRFIYEPDAYAMETASVSVREEWKRKVRISAGGFQAMTKLRSLLNPFRYGVLSFQYISHRVLRWTLAPLFLPLIMISNLILALEGDPIYILILALQIIFYLIAWLGHLFQYKKISIKGFFVPYYFLIMNLSVYAGLLRYLKGRQSVVWDKSIRASNHG